MNENTPNDEVDDLEVDAEDVAGGGVLIEDDRPNPLSTQNGFALPAVQGIATKSNTRT